MCFGLGKLKQARVYLSHIKTRIGKHIANLMGEIKAAVIIETLCFAINWQFKGKCSFAVAAVFIIAIVGSDLPSAVEIIRIENFEVSTVAGALLHVILKQGDGGGESSGALLIVPICIGHCDRIIEVLSEGEGWDAFYGHRTNKQSSPTLSVNPVINLILRLGGWAGIGLGWACASYPKPASGRLGGWDMLSGGWD